MHQCLEPLLLRLDASIRDAMVAIDRGTYEIALVVDQRGHLLGTVSDGDVRRALLAGHGLDDAVAPHMTKEPRTARVSDGRAEVLDLMQSHAIAQVPVVESDGRLVGLHVMRELLGSYERPNWAVIMAGGRGTRLAPLTDDIPKPMVKVAGRPVLERLLLHLVGSGIHRIFISVNYLGHVIESYFGAGEGFGCQIEYLREDPGQPLGTGGSLSLLADVAGSPQDPLLVMNGDLVTQFSVGELLEYHRERGATATVGVREYSHEVPFGVVEVDEAGRLSRFAEKPVLTSLINAGIYVLEPAAVARVPRTPYQLPGLLQDCLARGELVAAWHLDDDWHDVGGHAELRRATGHS